MKIITREGKAILSLDGKLTVDRAADLKDALLKSLKKSDTIEINLTKVSSIDLSCLQLLCSAHRSAAKEGKVLAVKDPASPVFLDARKNAGFMYSKPCRFVTMEDCLWVGGEE